MYQIKVNGIDYEVTENKTLLRFLRDDLHLKSVKDGCSEGACGTCHVLIGHQSMKCCIPTLEMVNHKTITTVEGLSDREKDVFAYAFGKAGAVQCGFCIPGMVISARALFYKNLDPTRAEAAYALRNNICRCTGYKKIIDGVLLAARFLRENLPIPEEKTECKVGRRLPRIDVREKVLGYGEYTDDIEYPDMCYASAVRAAYPRARVLAIDTSKAEALSGVIKVLTAADITGKNVIGHINKDWDTLIPVGENTRYLGDAIALVVAEDEQILEKAKKLVKVDYEPLPAVFSPEEALKEDAPLVHKEGNILAHEHLRRGDANKAIEESKYVVTNHYSLPFTEHAFLEPECAVALPTEEGVKIFSSDQGVYATRQECAELLGLPFEKVEVINKLVGGGFGGKEDMSVQHHAALAAYLLKRTVKVKLSRSESILVHPKRHPMEMEFTTACDENGNLTGMKAILVADTGAYASLGGPVLQRACTHAAGPYNYQNIDIDGKAVYTNNPPAGAFRGFGVTQSCFATECNLNQLAKLCGISPWEIRARNAIRPGQELPNGQIVGEETALYETLLAVKDAYESSPYVGIACAMKNAGVGVGLPDYGRVIIRIKEKKIHIYSGASCIGQGLGTVLVQMTGEMTNLPFCDIVYHASNSVNAPDSGTTSGSRQTLVTGEALRRACLLFLDDRKEHSMEELEGKEYYGEYLAKTDPLGADKKNPVSHVAYGYATQVCILDEDGRVKKIVAAHDVGRAINPLSVEGQIEGGVIMSLGYALREQYPLKEGKPLATYATLGLFRANETPEVESIIVEKNKKELALGGIGIGEITSIPTAPAIQGAYETYDGKFRTSLPLTDTPYSR
ncbi:MAG: selenium-dependent xanthine dehydrogenase [Lachnospiraceae bacterium]|nr:selenium-dependent xanthine dehydrogenase [Lachnospiraceae bacterium]